LRAKASRFWIILLLVLGLRDHQAIHHYHDPPHTASPFPVLAQSGHAEERNRCRYWG
jgi:hypothetical protein